MAKDNERSWIGLKYGEMGTWGFILTVLVTVFKDLPETLGELDPMTWPEFGIAIIVALIFARYGYLVKELAEESVLSKLEKFKQEMNEKIKTVDDKTLDNLKEELEAFAKKDDVRLINNHLSKIGNDHLIQRKINRAVVKVLADELPEIHDFVEEEKYDQLIEFIIQENQGGINKQEAIRITTNFKFKPERFYKPNKYNLIPTDESN